MSQRAARGGEHVLRHVLREWMDKKVASLNGWLGEGHYLCLFAFYSSFHLLHSIVHSIHARIHSSMPSTCDVKLPLLRRGNQAGHGVAQDPDMQATAQR